MNKINIINRCLLLLTGLFTIALGVVLLVKANLGITPVSCTPYILSLYFPLTLGMITIAFDVSFILMQIILRRRNYKIIQLLQLPVVMCFGFFIDLAMYLVRDLSPGNYVTKLLICLLGCLVLAFGVFMEVKAKVTYLAGEGLAVAVSETFNIEFGKAKIMVDSSLVTIGVICSIVLLKDLQGIREGTIIAAFVVGYAVRMYTKYIKVFDNLTNSDRSGVEAHPEVVTQNRVVTITCEYGSGGDEIGKLVARKLNLKFYDSSILQLSVEQSGYSKEYVRKNEEILKNSMIQDFYSSKNALINDQKTKLDALFIVQSKIIKDIGENENCVIVGRCAGYVLKNYAECFRVFVHANASYRKQRVMRYNDMEEWEAEREIERRDRYKANYYDYYTGMDWKNANNYHYTIDASLTTTENIANSIVNLVNSRFMKIRSEDIYSYERVLAN